MCRLLLVRSKDEFSAETFLREFAEISKKSREYQGHGWGCSMLVNDEWAHYRNINPVWEDDLSKFGKTTLLLAHARSAFRDEGIKVENNMPFYDGNYVFIFNGELRGVKINAEGRIGAEKIFNFIKRFNKGNMHDAIKKGVDVIKKRTSYIRALNFIISDKNETFAYSHFNEDEEYFTMKYSEANELIICSDQIPSQLDAKDFPNDTLIKF